MKLYEEDSGAAYFVLGCVLWPLLIAYMQVLTCCLCSRGLKRIEGKKVKEKNFMSSGATQPDEPRMGQLLNDRLSNRTAWTVSL